MALASCAWGFVGCAKNEEEKQEENPASFVRLFVRPTLGDGWAQKGLRSSFDGCYCLPPPLEDGLGRRWMALVAKSGLSPVLDWLLTLGERVGLALDGCRGRSGSTPNMPPLWLAGGGRWKPLSFPQGPTERHRSLMPRAPAGVERRG